MCLIFLKFMMKYLVLDFVFSLNRYWWKLILICCFKINWMVCGNIFWIRIFVRKCWKIWYVSLLKICFWNRKMRKLICIKWWVFGIIWKDWLKVLIFMMKLKMRNLSRIIFINSVNIFYLDDIYLDGNVYFIGM